MSGPTIDQSADAVGFSWLNQDGTPTTLTDLVAADPTEAKRWLPTHLEALDSALVTMAGTFGEILGGGRRPDPEEDLALGAAVSAVDRACRDYASAGVSSGIRPDTRAGQIIGTAVIMSVRGRASRGMMAPAPLDEQLAEPPTGVVGGHARLVWADEDTRWRGARWVVETTDGQRLPATLSMLLKDSSGVLTDAARDEHRAALKEIVEACGNALIEPIQASGAVDWLLFDFLMAHRDGPDSGAVELPVTARADARMIISAAAASVELRSRFDPALADT
ncbi:MAG: hypothetical protein ACK5MP_01725 [Nostocoides sp.]